MYAQDSWQLSRRRLNAGLRWEAQYFAGTNGRLAQSVTDEIQPRVGVIYLPGDLGSQRLFGSWGRFYEQVPVQLATDYYGEGQQLTIQYPQNPLVSTAGADSFAIPIGGAPRVHGLHGQNYDEFTVGYERRMGPYFKLGARGIHRALRWIIEGGFDPAQDRFVVGNLGLGALAYFRRARREYTALQLTFERLYAALGDKYRAFELLGKALVESSDPQQYLKVDPALDPIRSDPRFPLLLKRFGLE